MRENDKTFKELTLRTTENGWIEFKKEVKINPNNFFRDYANSLGLGKDYDFKATREQIDEKRRRHQRFQLHYKNIPVEGVEFSLHTFEDGSLQTAHGRIVENIDADVSKSMTERRALEIAIADKKLTLDDFKGGDNKPPTGTLMMAKLNPEFTKENYRLAYAFNVYGKSTFDAHRIYVDAQTGEIIKRSSLIRQCFHQHLSNEECTTSTEATAAVVSTAMPSAPMVQSTFVPNRNRYRQPGQNTQTFETQAFGNGFRLSMSTPDNAAALHTRIDQAPFGVWDNSDIEVQNPNVNFGITDVEGRNIQNATTAHWTVWRMHEFFLSRYRRNGVNKNGNIARVLVNMDRISAYWDTDNIIRLGFGPQGGMGPGDVTSQTLRDDNRPLAVLDITAHEYMHGVTFYSAGLTIDRGYEAGSLDEGISDIFGKVMERHLLGNNSWIIGEDSWGIRNMANPLTSLRQVSATDFPNFPNQPDRYLGQNWLPNGRHQNNGVLNKWFHSICTGQNPYANNIQAIDFDRATNIVYQALDLYLQPYASYLDMREATIMAARNLYGSCSFEEESVTNAWSAANIGALYYRSCGGTGNAPAEGCYTIKAQHSNKILQPENANNGARVRQYDANGSADQIVELSVMDGESYAIKAKSTGKAFEIPNTSGGDIQIRTNIFTFDDKQKWLMIRRTDGSHLILPKLLSGRALDVEGASQNNGAGVQVWGLGISDESNQRFILQPTGCTTTPPTSCASGSFNGYFDYANCNNFGGWALDQNNFGRTVDVDIFVDGTKVGTVAANESRGDLVGAFGNNPQAEFHGWTYNVPATASWRNGQNRIVTARPCGSTADISGSPKNVACTGGTGTQPPTTSCAAGNFSGYFDTGACGVMNGWALDQNNFNRTVDVEIRVDGVLVATVQANQSRPDLVSGFGGNPAAEFHGWWYYPPANASWKNGVNRTVTARICGANGDLNASPKTVNCTGGSGGCTPPGAPSISANPSSINAGGSATLTASGCGGSVSWSGGQTGNSTVVSPSATTSYTATCTVGGCVSATSNSVTVTVNGGGSTCAGGNFTGQFDTGACGVMNGWALDQNNFNRTVNVEIRVDGVLVATVPANQSRFDLVEAFNNNPAAEFHGWWYYVPTNAPWRNGTKTVSTRICGASSDLPGSPKTLNFTNCRLGVESLVSDETTEEGSLTLSPNPTDGELRFGLGLATTTDVAVSLSDANGRVLLTKSFKNKTGRLDEKLDLRALPDGAYIFECVLTTQTAPQKRLSRKVLVAK